MRRITASILCLALLALGLSASASVAQSAAEGSLELVGHSPLNNRGMNAAPAIHGDYAYVGSRTDAKLENANGAGVLIVDISDPTAPEVVGEIGPPDEANPGETSRELRIWPEQELLIVMTLFSNCSSEIHMCTPIEGPDRFNFYDISGNNAAAPKLVSTYDPSINPHEFFLWDDPKRSGRALLYIAPAGSSQLLVTDISGARKGEGEFKELLTTPIGYQSGGLHSLSISNDGTRGYMAHLTGGVGVIDTSAFANPKAKPAIRVLTSPAAAPRWDGPGPHSAVKVWGKDYMLITDEVYGAAMRALGGHGCPWG